MKKLLILFLVLSPTFSFARDNPTPQATTRSQTALRTYYPNTCGTFSDSDCWGRPVGSFCFKDTGQYNQTGSCMITGLGSGEGDYSCTCF